MANGITINTTSKRLQETTTEATVHIAQTVVQDILDQIREKDAPPINERPMSPSSTATHDDDASINPSFVPLGHGPLVALCAAALRDNTTTGSTQGDAPSKPDQQIFEEKKDEFDAATKSNIPTPKTILPTTPRLHLFGSEYARHSTQCPELRPVPTSRRLPPQPRRSRKSTLPDHRYLLAAHPATQVGALLDICVAFHEHDPPPPGYYRINAPGFYLHVKQEPLWDKAAQRPCLTALVLSSVCPPGFSIVRVGRHGPPAAFSGGLFLCLRRSREGNPLTGLLVVRPPTAIPDGYTVLERTFQHHAAVLPGPCFLAVRQRLCSLEATATPLVRGAYYATGNTWVNATRLGRFHLLDRSTHALLSPSALTHRLQWLQRSSTSWSTATTPSTTYAESSGPGTDDDERHDDDDDTYNDADFIPRVAPHPLGMLLHTILTACYTRHGGASWVAIQGLTQLWEQPHAIEPWWWYRDATHTVSALDVATQALCEVATSGSQAVVQNACVEACRLAVRTGHLGSRALGFVIRLYWFVWLSDPGESNVAADALQEVLTVTLQGTTVNSIQTRPKCVGNSSCGYLDGMMHDIVEQAADTAVDAVDRAQWMQQVLHQIEKSGGSELFWHEMVHTCGQALWNDGSPVIIAFAVLESLIKVACAPANNASKGLSLDLLLLWLKTSTAEDDTLVYAVRRTVVPCLLANTQASLAHPLVLRRVLRIMTVLWSSPVYRQKCKIEIGVLLDHFVVRLLELGPQWPGIESENGLVTQQIQIMEEMEVWFSLNPADVLELFLNYDADGDKQPSPTLPPGPQWNILQRLIMSLSSIAESCGELISRQIEENQSLILNPNNNSEGRKDAQGKAQMRKSARLLRKASLECLSKITKCVAVSASTTAGIEFSSLMLSWFPETDPSAILQLGTLSVTALQPDHNSTVADDEDDELLDFWSEDKPIDEERHSVAEQPRCSPKDALQVGFAIAKTKSLKKSVEYLIACNVLAPTPRNIANFLQVHKEEFEPSSLGAYLSEAGNGGAEIDFWTSLRQHYIRSISFIGMNVEAGFRHFIATAGFSLPGEAQKIDRILGSFVRCYFEDNAGDTVHCPFQDEDTVYLLAFAIVMLNTDLHKSNILSGRKGQKKMTKVEFMNNFKSAIQHDVFPRQYVSKIYDSIADKPIQFLVDRSGKKKKDIESVIDNFTHADAMLRGVAVNEFKFDAIGTLQNDDLSNIAVNCVSNMWHNLHGVINTCLECAHLDPEGLERAVDILLYALVVTVCLDMPLERSAFLAQFVRLCLFGEKIRGRIDTDFSMRVKQLRWFEELEELCAGPTEHRIEVLRKTRSWVGKLKASLCVDLCNKTEMSNIVLELDQGEFLLNDPARSFLQSGNLVKVSNKTGRPVDYKFFLFSDLLLYTSAQDDGKYKIHEELPLHLMKIVDWFPLHQKNRHLMFQVHHPRKTFAVVCPTPEARRAWVEDIRAAIMVEMERKMAVEAARVSTH